MRTEAYMSDWTSGERWDIGTREDWEIFKLPRTHLKRREREVRGCLIRFGRELPNRLGSANVEKAPWPSKITRRFRRRVCILPFGHVGAHRGPIMSLCERERP